MKELFQMFGMMPAMHTPFTEDAHINIAAPQKIIDSAIQPGVFVFSIPVVANTVNTFTMDTLKAGVYDR